MIFGPVQARVVLGGELVLVETVQKLDSAGVVLVETVQKPVAGRLCLS